MNNIVRVLSQAIQSTQERDLFVCAIGFEARATYLARTHQGSYKTAIALAFGERKVFEYENNLKWCTDAAFQIVDFNHSIDESRLVDIFEDLLPNESSVSKILVDVSSMSRPMIALIVRALVVLSTKGVLQAEFAYCPSNYVELGNQLYSASYIGPVIPAYAGWSPNPKAAVVAIAGLGGEQGLALGAIEYLEATDVWAFLPGGVDVRFDDASRKANSDLLRRIGDTRVTQYDLNNPFDWFCALEALTYGCLATERPILLPFGPKIFSVACLLVAEIYRPRVPVWRVSAEQDAAPVNRVASGSVVSLTAEFGSLGPN